MNTMAKRKTHMASKAKGKAVKRTHYKAQTIIAKSITAFYRDHRALMSRLANE